MSLAVVLGALACAHATVYDLQPGTLSSPGSLSPILNALPGDTFILHATATNRVYGRVYTATAWSGKGGSAAGGWVTIKGADGEPRPLITYSGGNNVFELPSVQYMQFQNIEITGGSAVMRFTGTCHDITLDGLYIHGNSDVAVSASGITELYHLTVRNCEIGPNGSPGYGEGMYLGVASGTSQPQVHDSLIERNYVHDTGADGIELKAGCYSVTVQDNVIMNTYYPGITIYGTYKNDPAKNYQILRNFIAQYTGSDACIQCTSEANIINNILTAPSETALNIRQRDLDGKLQYINVINNTFFYAAGDLIGFRNGNIALNCVFANNAIIQNDAAAAAFTIYNGVSATTTITNNVTYGYNSNVPGGVTAASSPAAVFVNPSTTLGEMDLYPAVDSPLIDTASATYTPANDFNSVARPQGAASDIGAYEVFHAGNPGWKIAAGFKTVGVPGDLDGDGHVDVIDLLTFIASFGTVGTDPGFNPACDFNADGSVDVVDLLYLIDNFGM